MSSLGGVDLRLEGNNLRFASPNTAPNFNAAAGRTLTLDTTITNQGSSRAHAAVDLHDGGGESRDLVIARPEGKR